MSRNRPRRRAKTGPRPTDLLVNAEQTRAALVQRMDMSHKVAMQAEVDPALRTITDPMLAAEYVRAVEQGMPRVSLDGVYEHRHAQHIEQALDSWFEASRGGPCQACGSLTMRKGGFGKVDGITACGSCAWYIREYGLTWYKARVFGALTGVTGLPMWGNYVGVVKLAHEVGYEGEPWKFLEPHRNACIVHAIKQGVPLRKFAATRGAIEQASLPGLAAPDAPPSPELFAKWRPTGPATAKVGTLNQDALYAQWERDMDSVRAVEASRKKAHRDWLARMDASR